MEKDKVKIRELFWSFFQIGAFTFGGGYAMIPLIEKETVEKKQWVSETDILDIVAIAESTPGPVAINAATFIGYQARGIPGAVTATLGVAAPAFLVILLAFAILRQFQECRAVRYAFFGIRAGVLALLAKTFVSMFRKRTEGKVPLLFIFGACLLSLYFSVNTIWIIVICGAGGLCCTLWAGRKL